MTWRVPLIALVCFLLLATVAGASGQCSGAKTCSTCIKTHPACRWCLESEYDGSRCQSDANPEVGPTTCTDWFNPASILNEDKTDFSDIIQVQPTKIVIENLRPGEEYKIPVTVKSAQNYPLDVYYLMDFSYSMLGDLEKLKTLTAEMTDSLGDISANYSLGFGTFVDKPISPYANTEGNLLEEPCENCQAVHSFNHEMSLTSVGADAKATLLDKLDQLKISSNIDNPEGGFDAMVQAALCNEEIGWREPSRRVIFYASDAVFHVAGDGKLAGIVKPNQGQCGMEGNKYARSLTEDYPSVGQLNDILIKNKVIPIFAVTAPYQNLYETLSKHLTQLSSVGKLSDTSENVAELIKNQLSSIVESTQLNPQAPQGVTITVNPKCSETQTLMPNGLGCKGVSTEENVEFDMIISVDECIAGRNAFDFDIEVPGIATIPISITMQCTCPCETDGSGKKNAVECNKSGDLICGACQCQTGNYGDECECDQKNDKSNEACINPETGSICGGENNGKCICGQCECIQPSRDNHMRWGEFCECSNYECPRNVDNQICSGNGYCFCGDCDCSKDANGTPKPSSDPLFTGPDCGCPVSKQSCIAPDSGLECAGPANGECVCGACECKEDHFGQFCDICQDCGPLNCTQYIPCVRCMFDSKNDDGNSWKNCDCEITTSLSNDERVDTSKLGRHKQCAPIRASENCDILFYLHYEDLGTTAQPNLKEILIDRELDCPTQPNIIAIVAGVIGGILAVGILLLILWKIYTTIIDKREYTKFLEERSKAKWNTGLSPLYKEPMTKYTNPLYAPAASRI